MKTPLAAAGLDRHSQVLFSTLHPRPILRQKYFYSVPKGKPELADVWLCLPPPALCWVQYYLLSASPPSLLRTRSSPLEQSGQPHQATSPAPWNHTQCHECRLSRGPEHPNDKKGSMRSTSKPVLSQLQHLNPEISTCRAFTRGSNYADADLQEWWLKHRPHKNCQGDFNCVCLIAEPSISTHLISSLKVRSFLFFFS